MGEKGMFIDDYRIVVETTRERVTGFARGNRRIFFNRMESILIPATERKPQGRNPAAIRVDKGSLNGPD
jgi:hypothetical protein